jgi:hypothetical protein
MKDKVDNQVQDMLQKGLIQPSNNAFSSPVVTTHVSKPYETLSVEEIPSLESNSKFSKF